MQNAKCKSQSAESRISHFAIYILHFALILGCGAAASAAPAQAAVPETRQPPTADAWPMFRGDPQGTGVAQGSLPEKLALRWTFTPVHASFESAAAIVDGVVFAGSSNGKFYAVDLASGRKRWEFATEAGFSAAPSVRDALVFVGDRDGRFHCLDAASGKRKWYYDAGGEIDSGANFHHGTVLFGSQDCSLYCLAVDSGKAVWKYESENQIRCFPTIVEGRAFVAGCDGQLHVIDAATGKEIGKADLESYTGCTPAILGDMVFVGTEGKVFLGVNWRRGVVAWRYENELHGQSFRSSAAVVPELVVVGAQDKLVHALDPKSGRKLWTFTTHGRVDSSPVIVGARVFVGSADGTLYALDRATGRPLWQFTSGGKIVASAAVAGGCLVIGSDSGDLYCFGAK
jgi:outer membrane protein assembly factor BamB